jgi:hypothetical protein
MRERLSFKLSRALMDQCQVKDVMPVKLGEVIVAAIIAHADEGDKVIREAVAQAMHDECDLPYSLTLAAGAIDAIRQALKQIDN